MLATGHIVRIRTYRNKGKSPVAYSLRLLDDCGVYSFRSFRGSNLMLRRATFAVAILVATTTLAFSCGVERWPVKVGEDKDVAKVATEPRPSTIFELSSIQPPSNPNIRRDTRYSPVELTTFEVTGRLTLVKKEADDDDYHLVIRDNRGRTMIIEAPEPDCASNSRFLDKIKEVRQALDDKFGPITTRKQHPNIRVTVTGVGFFDKKHGQEGIADNGIELHPILEIVFEPPQ
jgi:hypothetical protein